MAAAPKLTIRLTAARSSSGISVRTAGEYAGLRVNDIDFDLLNQPVQPTSSSKALWTAVLAAVQAHIATL